MSTKLPTLKEIAKRLNISVSTVSRALHNHHSIGLRTKMRVNQLAAELNYEPNQTAIFFKKRKTFTIGVILPHLSQDFFAAIVSGIEDVAFRKNFTVLLGQSRDDEEREKRVVETMKNHRVDGMLISLAKNTSDYGHFELLKKYNIPVVFFDRIPKMKDIHYTASELAVGMNEIIGFLVKRKFRNIAMINGPGSLLASKERLEAYMKSLPRHRIKIDMGNVVISNLSPESTCQAMQELLALKRRPTAIITFNDYVAMDAIRYAKKQKIRINKDICFVSFSNQPICNYLDDPPLASVEQFPYEQGEKATEILLELIEKNDEVSPDTIFHKVLLQSRMVVHEIE
jgi:LacI family transcriptional regulator